MNGRTSKIFIALYFALYLCLLIPGHLAMFAAEGHSTRTVETSHPDHSHHDPNHCAICLTSGQVAAVTVDCPPSFYQRIGHIGTETLTPGADVVTDLSTDPRAPPAA